MIGAFQTLTNVLIAKNILILDKSMAILMMENVFGYQLKKNASPRNGLLTSKWLTTNTVLVKLLSCAIDCDYVKLTFENLSCIDILFFFNFIKCKIQVITTEENALEIRAPLMLLMPLIMGLNVALVVWMIMVNQSRMVVVPVAGPLI